MSKDDPFSTDADQGDLVRDETVKASLKRAVKRPHHHDDLYSDHSTDGDPQAGTLTPAEEAQRQEQTEKKSRRSKKSKQPKNEGQKSGLAARWAAVKQAWAEAMSQAEQRQQTKRAKKDGKS